MTLASKPFIVDAECMGSEFAPGESKFKQAVARSFGRAAQTYDQAAHFQRAVGEQLFPLIEQAWGCAESGSSVETILDLGCGTGYFRDKLQAIFTNAYYLGLDLSAGMIDFARQRSSDKQSGNWLVADSEKLPFSDKSVQIVYSNLSIQWSRSLDDLFDEVWRILQPGGIFVFSSLLPGTLVELAQAWAAVDGYQHVNDFNSMKEHRNSAQQSGFSNIQLHHYHHQLEYDRVTGLTGELKRLGAHNVNSGRSPCATGRDHLKQFIKQYEQFRMENGKLPASYEVLLGIMSRPLSPQE